MRPYRLLLRLYPASFRYEYGEELCLVFDRRRRDAAGRLAILAFWIGVVVDTAANGARVHLDILRQDLRYSARTLLRTPGFSLTAIVVGLSGWGRRRRRSRSPTTSLFGRCPSPIPIAS